MSLCVKIVSQGCRAKASKCEKYAELEIPAPLEVGQKLSYIGIPDRNAQEFSIMLVAKDGDVAMNVYVNLRQNFVKLDYKSYGGSNMSQQLNFDDVSFPFSRCKPFRLAIDVLRDEYKLSVTGQHLAHFLHRIDPKSVTTMIVKGDITTKELRIG